MTDYAYTTTDVLLEVSKLSVSYDHPVLRDVDFAIKDIIRPGKTQGQVVAILAPSGTGKSQLFNCIAGIQKPTSGEIWLGAGEQRVQTRAGLVGVVAQDYPLFDHLTVLENMRLVVDQRIKTRVEADALIMSELAKFGLENLVHQYPKQISGGQRQRVAILQQSACSEHFLLMDEPFSGLDPNAKEDVQNLIISRAEEDELNTIILTTHDIPSAIAVSDEILLLGKDRDATGAVIPGARIQESINLIDLGLAWRRNIEQTSAFISLQSHLRERFRTL